VSAKPISISTYDIALMSFFDLSQQPGISNIDWPTLGNPRIPATAPPIKVLVGSLGEQLPVMIALDSSLVGRMLIISNEIRVPCKADIIAQE